jgi:predicted RecA/RadA family phage recombinase
MKRRTKEKIGKYAGTVAGIGIGVGLTFVALSSLATGGGGLIFTTGLCNLGKLVGGGMARGLVVTAVGNGVTATTGSHVGEKVASKIGNKKKKK